MKQRIRDVRQGPDGLVYVLTDEDNGAFAASRTGAVNVLTVCVIGLKPAADLSVSTK